MLYLLVALDFELYLDDCFNSGGYGAPAKPLCGQPSGAALVQAIIAGSAQAKRIYLEDIETFVRVLKAQPDSAQVNLIGFNREALERYQG